MPKRLLIATLGTSPAVVTEALDLLAAEYHRPDGVVLLLTEDTEVRESCQLLAEHLPHYYGISWIEPLYTGYYGDVNTAEAAVAFLQLACQVLKRYRDAGHERYVCIAGGRKVMSTPLALAVQFYGAERLFHVWALPWIEAEGEIGKLRHLWRHSPEAASTSLHPPLKPDDHDRPRLVDLPFISLFPWLSDILSGLQQQGVDNAIRQMLLVNRLLTKEGHPTSLGEAVKAVLEEVENLPPARQEECRLEIRDHHGKKQLSEFATRLCERFPFVTRAESIAYGPQEGVQAQPPNQIRVYVRLFREINLGLCLTTTAMTAGQLEAARQAIERHVSR